VAVSSRIVTRSHVDLGLIGACALVLLVGCAGSPRRAEESATSRDSAPASDTAQLARLEREARALAKTDGCTSASACRTAPVGWRGCGGPRTYIVYCAASTDSVALFRKLSELKAAEQAYNEQSGMMSTCEMRLPPTIVAQGGRCGTSR
jgi:hypothetical protein